MKTSEPTADSADARNVRRVVPDIVALKALAHPVRLRMLGLLRLEGAATATQLAARLGLNSGATSYHLRQLARHGFIEEQPGPSRRDRFWRAVHEVTEIFPVEGDDNPEALEAGFAFTQAALTLQVDLMQRSVEELADLPPAWRQASTASDFTIPMTPEQATVLTKRIEEVLFEAMRSAPPLGEPLPPGMAAFSILLHAFPYPGRLAHAEDEEPL
ncbi:helix-turn-helix domain-containing protein [Allorhizobium sp. BGMRC 0089]|uniref:winged helix-turn-helix domain-containing protein n=1 Tax=Allorhizobium sonneratiae TaxID=2934936 RepID=UPI0020343ADD|nr:helix-turn-helix domain-containing protein [Allorhizobium sonneratiae]MCM2292902.1 helix-turn-helix domain-containing protein [Allorhizobium sonneratiae]